MRLLKTNGDHRFLFIVVKFLIVLTTLMFPFLILFPQSIHSLVKAAIFQKILLQTLQLLEKQIIRLFNQDYAHIGNGFWRTGTYYVHKELRVIVFATKTTHNYVFYRSVFPQTMIAGFQIILVILQ